MKIFEELQKRGLIAQVTDEKEIKELINNGGAKFYIGFDPTADSLHVGHFMALCLMKRLQDAGNKPIVLIGGGTGHVGDPSGRTDMRSMMTRETIEHNCNCFKKQMERFIKFCPRDFRDKDEVMSENLEWRFRQRSHGSACDEQDEQVAETCFFGANDAIMVNNADWLLKLNYVELLREVGACFSVNNMLRAECYKQRMEKGLSFLEFNYMIMQAYDFYYLHEKYGCNMQFGGDDQWSNMLAGTELIRKKSGDDAYAMTITLLMNSEGKKMGKTAKGAVWLDPEKTSPYEFYQYWRNVDDADVMKCLKLLTFIPIEAIEKMGEWADNRINEKKEILAYHLTELVHGKDEADKAQATARAIFSGAGDSENMPTTELNNADFESGSISVLDLLIKCGFTQSRGEGKRLIQQGGVSIDNENVNAIDKTYTQADFANGLVVKKGKKNFRKVLLSD